MPTPKRHGGETREQRLLEFIEANLNTYVAGLREGSRFLVEDGQLTSLGSGICVYLRRE